MENEKNAGAAAEEQAAPKSLFKLKLDHDGVYWGAEAIAAEDIKDDDVILDHAPDNPPGRYKWNAEQQRLDPLPPTQVKTAQEAPSLEQAFSHLLASLDEAGHALPPAVKAWAAEFKRTIEGKQ